jgi:iron only hydrogenase large subunit-like protein
LALNKSYAAHGSGKGITETETEIQGTKVKTLIVSGLANARAVMESIRRGECDAAFVKIMSCPNGWETDAGCEADSGCANNGAARS